MNMKIMRSTVTSIGDAVPGATLDLPKGEARDLYRRGRAMPADMEAAEGCGMPEAAYRMFAELGPEGAAAALGFANVAGAGDE